MANTKETKKTEKKNNVHEVIVKIEGVEWTEALDKAFKSKQKDAKVDGFRKGKVPRNIYEKHYGKESLFFLAAEEVLQSAYAKAMEESNLIPVVQPSVDIKDISDKGVEFTFKIITKPEVKIKNYKGLGIKPEEIKVTKDEIDHEIGHLLEEYTELVTKEGEVKNGDVAVIDFEGFKDGKPFDGGKGENYSLEIGSNTFIPGFEDQVIGMNIDEEREIKVKFPEEYFSKDLAGKDAIFKVKVNEIKKKELPKLDDEFAKDVSEFDTLKELKADIKSKKEKENEEKAKYETQDAIMKALCENVKVEIPSGMVELEIDNMLKDIEQRLAYQGLKLEQYLQMMGKTEEEFRKEYEPQAIEGIKSRLALEAIIKAEKIEATKKEIDEKMKEMAKNYGKEDDKEFLKNENVRNYIKQGLESEKAIEFLVENAKIK